MPSDAATILDIVLACRRISRFLASTDQSAFLDDEEKQWAVVSQLMLVGEAVRRLSVDFRENMTNVPWQQIAGMRNRLIHQYDKINWTLVWKTAKEDVSQLLTKLEPLVLEPDDNDSIGG